MTAPISARDRTFRRAASLPDARSADDQVELDVASGLEGQRGGIRPVLETNAEPVATAADFRKTRGAGRQHDPDQAGRRAALE